MTFRKLSMLPITPSINTPMTVPITRPVPPCIRVPPLTTAVRRALQNYNWPGNVRELKNVIESMIVIDSDGILDVDDLTEDLIATTPATPDGGASSASHLVGRPLEEIEKYFEGSTQKQVLPQSL